MIGREIFRRGDEIQHGRINEHWHDLEDPEDSLIPVYYRILAAVKHDGSDDIAKDNQPARDVLGIEDDAQVAGHDSRADTAAMENNNQDNEEGKTSQEEDQRRPDQVHSNFDLGRSIALVSGTSSAIGGNGFDEGIQANES